MSTTLFQTPLTVMFAGPSGCGKTELVKQIAARPEVVFDRPPKQIIICYDRTQTAYEDIKNASKIPVRLVKGLPPNLNPMKRTLIIIDDLQQFSDLICDWFTKGSHHGDCDVIYLTQNLFLKTPSHRTASLNAHVLVIFKNLRDKTQIKCLARQLSPDDPHFIMSAYEQATSRAYGYLVINLKQDTPDRLRVRDSFFPEETNFYLDKRSGEIFELS